MIPTASGAITLILCWFGLCVGIPLLIHRFVFKRRFSEDEDACKAILIGLIASLIIGILTYVLWHPCQSVVRVTSWNIHAIKDTTITKGSRYYFEENMNYFYLADYKDGQKMYSVDKNKSYIVEDDSQVPHIEEYVNTYKNPNRINKFFWDEAVAEYKIVVPKSTMTNEFKIDMEK
jgi:hypothetical protein